MDAQLFSELVSQIRFNDHGYLPETSVDIQSIVLKIVNAIPMPLASTSSYVSSVLYENKEHRVNYFRMIPGCIIIEHDHPFEQGVLVVVAGSCLVKSLTLLEISPFESRLSIDHEEIKTLGDVTSYGTRQSNIHGLRSEGGVCFLNICKKGRESQRYYYLSLGIDKATMRCKRSPIKTAIKPPSNSRLNLQLP